MDSCPVGLSGGLFQARSRRSASINAVKAAICPRMSRIELLTLFVGFSIPSLELFKETLGFLISGVRSGLTQFAGQKASKSAIALRLT
jgi:hypothetical protein